MTGLAAGIASGLPVFEASDRSGGICSSYYVRPGQSERLSRKPDDGEAYHFEIGGGHWIFGGDPAVLRFIRGLTEVKSYARRSSVFFPKSDLYVPYPLQNHLRFVNHGAAEKALAEMGTDAIPFVLENLGEVKGAAAREGLKRALGAMGGGTAAAIQRVLAEGAAC